MRTPVRTTIHCVQKQNGAGDIARPRRSVQQLPTILLSNAQSLVNKLDELQLLLNKEHVDIGVFTESWFSSSLHNDQTSVPGYPFQYQQIFVTRALVTTLFQ